MGIRTPVASVRGSHDWPDYTIAAELLNKMGDEATYSLLPCSYGVSLDPFFIRAQTTISRTCGE